MKNLEAFLLFCFLLTSTGCGEVLYLSRLGWYQSTILLKSIPVEEVLNSEEVSPLIKDKIRLIQEVKRYGEERLGLKRTKNYSKFFEVRGPILHIVTASEKDRLHPYAWKFPIVGKMTYKSFFTFREALKEKETLDRRGYDTFLQHVWAYSTLGWLNDPIFSPMLQWDEGILAEVILHEMVHATVYFRDQTDFNEQLAMFIGNQGAIDFLTQRHGPASKEVEDAQKRREDEALFSQWIEEAHRQLSAYYEKEIAREEKLRGREALFRVLEENLKKLKSEFRTDDYRQVERLELNNAVLLAYRRYFHRPEKFEAIYKYFGKDLKRMIGFFKEVQASKEDPVSFIDDWLRKGGTTVPSSPR